jgi:hypothetical protein
MKLTLQKEVAGAILQNLVSEQPQGRHVSFWH